MATKAKARKRQRKPKSDHLHIRVLGEQLDRWHEAAQRDQRSLSSWVAFTLDAALSAKEKR